MGKKKALLEAVKAGDDAKVQKIVAKAKGQPPGVDVCDEAGYSPLTHAAMLGYCKILRYLMQAGTDMNLKDAQGRTALDVAALCDRVEVVRVLIEYEGISIDEICGKMQQTALEAALEVNNTGIVAVLGKYCGKWLVDAAKKGDIARIKELVERPGIHLEAQDFTGWTALHVAMKNNLGEAVEVLAKAGALADVKNRNGQTPFDVAEECEHTDLIADYHTAKANATRSMRFETPEKQAERTARQSGHTTQADLLKKHKRKSLPAGIMRRINQDEEPAPKEHSPVVMTKEAWKHKDGASGKDADLIAQLTALKHQMKADTVAVSPGSGESESITRPRSFSKSAPSSPRGEEGGSGDLTADPVRVNVKGSWIRKGGAGKDSDLMRELSIMKQMMESDNSPKPKTIDIGEAQRQMRERRAAAERNREDGMPRKPMSMINPSTSTSMGSTSPREISVPGSTAAGPISPRKVPLPKARVRSLPAGAGKEIRQKLKGIAPPSPDSPGGQPRRAPPLVSSGGRPSPGGTPGGMAAAAAAAAAARGRGRGRGAFRGGADAGGAGRGGPPPGRGGFAARAKSAEGRPNLPPKPAMPARPAIPAKPTDGASPVLPPKPRPAAVASAPESAQPSTPPVKKALPARPSSPAARPPSKPSGAIPKRTPSGSAKLQEF